MSSSAVGMPIPDQGRWVASVVRGQLAYYAVPTNSDAVQTFGYPGDPPLVCGAAASART
ncbi:MAG: hypothetical protein M3276_03150 [Actinomycetota bacterium]|nr:hypothetical protein [Actinomycetota bacterium]